MRRALAILKYVPALLCGLLVVVWFAGLRTHYQFGFGSDWVRDHMLVASCIRGTLSLLHAPVPGLGNFGSYSAYHLSNDDLERLSCLGKLELEIYGGDTYTASSIAVPIAFLLTLLVPLAIAPITRFRFPVWSWFAYTALIAAELAYYLR